MTHNNNSLRCNIIGIGAWGPGFNNWPELKALLLQQNQTHEESPKPVTPKPTIIPANERRRSPLPVKIAVETSWQAAQQSTLEPHDMACVFGSGLGDTEITNYMCRALNNELKQLSPTKFHNSVHNAAAGYWTISTDCMKSANSIAAYDNTAGLALLEGLSQCVYQDELVLVTLFDDKAHNAYRDIFPCDTAFSAALVLSPEQHHSDKSIARLDMQLGSRGSAPISPEPIANAHLDTLYHQNPAAKILNVLQAIAKLDDASPSAQVQLNISENTQVTFDIAQYNAG
ncbi:beta-ketoacyl synthase chain length factor [Agarilytica rhodophyticola]|uniref:beta-ketoacyl synthase chain length factor n=1 Tax=Agarilytica rhodophyticola TaxID=1737490 RepID=UPI001319E8C5|nr:beta-ketoacyl synthase chain length factor [Agarilytica rhodophyticola]